MSLNNLPVIERQRRDATVRAVTRRGRLTAGTPPRPLDPAFLQRLREFDDSLDLSWHPIREVWVLYRVAQKATAKADDKLILISVLKDWPGQWVIDHLKSIDIVRRHPEANTPERAAKLDMDDLDRSDEARIAANEKKTDEICRNTSAELRPVFAEREMVVANETPTEPVEHPKRKVIWSSGSSTTHE